MRPKPYKNVPAHRMERWPSGLRRTPGKRVGGNASQVRILSSPPFLARLMKLFSVFILVFFLFLSGSQAEERTAGMAGVQRAETVYEFQGREYLFYDPAPGKTKPLLIVLHGGGGNPRHIRRSLDMDPEAASHGFAVAYLSGNPGQGRIGRNLLTWNGGGCCGNAVRQNRDDVSYIDAFITHAIKRHNADSSRIYMLGHSNGAIMTYRFACEKPGRLAAIIPVSGTLMVDQCNTGALPVLHIHGEKDTHVLPGGGYGPDSVVKVDFTSISATKRILEASGADMTVMLVPGAPHKLSGISAAMAAQGGQNLSETAARFIADKKLR